MQNLALWILGLILTATKPGGSAYSFEPIEACGTDPEHAACALEPVCPGTSPLCRPPRWSKARGAWVRSETREVAAQRYRPIAVALANVVDLLLGCKDRGAAVEDCSPVRWKEGPKDLAAAILTVAVWESGLREDIESGFAPAGRGPDGEVCLMQIMPRHVALFSRWLPEGSSTEAATAALLGPENLEHCFEVGGRILARKRGNARVCKGIAWDYATFAFYGTGNKCSTVGIFDDFAAKRQKTYRRFLATRDPTLPDWVVHAIEPAT